ncbi:MAG: hypothetical protein K2H39_04795, partial [Paramuribaculum sp.]|nr:hypothetical protein [Paramuribaculum sp.]
DKISELRETADSLHSIGRTDSAAIVGEQALCLAIATEDPTQIVGTYAAQGVFLRSLGKIDEALKCYDAALAIITSGKFRKNPDQEAIEEIASLYINLAVLNLDMQHEKAAAKNAELSGEWISKSNDPELKSTILGVVGSVLTGCGNLEKALYYQSLAYKYAVDSNNKEAAFRCAAYTLLISDRLGKKDEAQAWREKCESLLPDIESVMARLVFYQAECSICLRNGNPKEAIIWFNKILNVNGIDNLPYIKFDCFNNLHIAYAGLGDYQNAYSYLLKGNELRDSIWETEKAESLRDLTVKYETKETELALARSEAQRTSILMWFFAALGLLLASIIMFVIYANRQRHQRMRREIEFANLRADIGKQLTQQYVEGLENERQRMSRELHDGVCNDLLAIQMNISGGNPIESTAALIDSCRESVRRISHELMPPEFAYATIDEVIRFFIVKQTEANKGKINFAYYSDPADWQIVPDVTALEVYRIVQEAVGNAIKHSGATDISVALRLNNGLLTTVISDNGKYKSNGRKGLGLDSMRRRARSINGNIELSTDETVGTEVILTVKI